MSTIPSRPASEHGSTATTADHDHGSGAASRAAVVTSSDGASHGAREDRSGDALATLLAERGFDVAERRVVPDERDVLVATIEDLCASGTRLVVITGGTGLGPRDVTPEAVAELGGRVLPGFGEVMRATGRTSTPMADLSRSVAVAVDQTLVVAVPGSPRGAVESLEAVADLLPHALDLLVGDTAHADPPSDAGHDHDHGEHDHRRDIGTPAHGDAGHVHDAACATAHGDADQESDEEVDGAGTLMAVFASPLAALLLAWGRELGWDTVLVDPRVATGTDPVARREVDGMVVTASTAGADATTDVVVTDHHRDELVDLLDAALNTDARFIGLMGSARHQGPHVAPLRERGRSDDDLGRIVRPIGIDIGSRTPAEIAVSTLADLVARRRLPSLRSFSTGEEPTSQQQSGQG